MKTELTEKEKAYFNSHDLDSDIVYLAISRGDRIPQNEKEERWQDISNILKSKRGH